MMTEILVIAVVVLVVMYILQNRKLKKANASKESSQKTCENLTGQLLQMARRVEIANIRIGQLKTEYGDLTEETGTMTANLQNAINERDVAVDELGKTRKDVYYVHDRLGKKGEFKTPGDKGLVLNMTPEWARLARIAKLGKPENNPS